jgi:ComF family protein
MHQESAQQRPDKHARAAVRTLRLVWEGLLDLIYPPHCLVCGQHGQPALCANCAAQFAPIPTPTCAVCGRPQDRGHDGAGAASAECRTCAAAAAAAAAAVMAESMGGWGFETARAAAIYEGALRQAIHRLKYNHAWALGEPLGAFLANRCVVDGLLGRGMSFDCVAPVPIHAARFRTRGFNQAALLAEPLAAMLGVPLVPHLLRRTRRTAPQVGLDVGARRQNLSGAFVVAGEPAQVDGRNVLLVDDVFTTGATVSACSHALRAAGARRVDVATLAAGG